VATEQPRSPAAYGEMRSASSSCHAAYEAGNQRPRQTLEKGNVEPVPRSSASPTDVLACALRLPVELPTLRPVLDAAAIIASSTPIPIRESPYISRLPAASTSCYTEGDQSESEQYEVAVVTR
jgi:hypothetical protein